MNPKDFPEYNSPSKESSNPLLGNHAQILLTDYVEAKLEVERLENELQEAKVKLLRADAAMVVAVKGW